jgi:hypothetical protein
MSDYQKYVTNDRTTDNSRMREAHDVSEITFNRYADSQ